MGGFAYIGAQTFKEKPLYGAMYGAAAIKLATTQGGTPPIAQIAGLSMLIHLGLASSKAGELVANYLETLAEGAPLDEEQLTYFHEGNIRWDLILNYLQLIKPLAYQSFYDSHKAMYERIMARDPPAVNSVHEGEMLFRVRRWNDAAHNYYKIPKAGTGSGVA